MLRFASLLMLAGCVLVVGNTCLAGDATPSVKKAGVTPLLTCPKAADAAKWQARREAFTPKDATIRMGKPTRPYHNGYTFILDVF